MYSTICTSKKYGHSPVKESEVDPWKKLCVNFIRSLYLWPVLSNRHDTINRGSEFMGEFARMVQKDYGVQKKLITTRNPQANHNLEWIWHTKKRANN
jgi:hypothetical protein